MSPGEPPCSFLAAISTHWRQPDHEAHAGRLQHARSLVPNILLRHLDTYSGHTVPLHYAQFGVHQNLRAQDYYRRGL